MDVADTGLFEMIPDARGKQRDAVALGDRQERRVAEQDRIVAVQDSLHAHDALVAAMGVVARPFAERPFGVRLFFGRRHFAFDDDLRRRRHRQAGEGRAQDFQRRAAQRAGVFVFADAGFGRGRRRHPGCRLAAEHDGDGAGLFRLASIFERFVCRAFAR